MRLRLPTVPEVFFFFAGFILKEKLPFRIFALKWGDMLVKFAFFSMQTYLTDVWGLSFTHAAALLNIWGAISKIFPLCSLFIADHFVGHFKMMVISSKACAVGIVLVTISTPPVLANSTGTCKEYETQCIGHTQKVVFYTGMALVALGIGGHGASILPFFEEQHSSYGRRNPFDLFMLYSIIGGFFAFPYIKQWYLLFGVPGICVVCATLAFLTGWCKYEKPKAQGSPLIDVFRVFVAAARKISQPIPLDSTQMYTKNDGGDNSVHRTNRFPRWLEKAAIILPDDSVEDQARNRWRLCSIEQVEAAKFVARVIPMGTTFIMCTIVSSAGNTLFVEQASHLNRKVGKMIIPTQVLLAEFYFLKMQFSSLARKYIHRSNYGRPLGIATAMIFSVLCCVTAARIEIKRLKVVRQHGLTNDPDKNIPMHAYLLGYQFILLAGQDSILRESIIAYWRWESPGEAMDRYICHFADALFGLGLVYSVLSVYVVGKISELGGRQSWFQDTLNKSRLDRYYWVLAALGALNLLIFIPLPFLYNYRKLQETDTNEEKVAGDDGMFIVVALVPIIGAAIALPYVKPWIVLFGVQVSFTVITILILTG